ncbi:50S ribosomal protein L25 [Candidatus Parcubacteria bacterium]|nr:MAG: 50S ribosomal protein L25 [Candidatus Parcubacteria bacterium]
MDLSVQPREKLGKSVRSLRKGGLIPGELYGHGVRNIHLAVPAKEFSRVFREAGSNTVVHLRIGEEMRPAIIYDIERDYLTDEVSHIDFYQVRMDQKIKARVPLEFTGEAPAVKEKGGILNKSVTDIEVEALPANLPHRLTVHLGTLDDLNKSLYVKDIPAPPEVRLLVDSETVVVTVTPPTAEEEKPEAPADVSAVKVETEEKKAERVAGKEEKKQEKE